jgi:hypothetical protein
MAFRGLVLFAALLCARCAFGADPPALPKVNTPCEAVERFKGAASDALFGGPQGAALKRSLGADADRVGRFLDAALASQLAALLGDAAQDCPQPSPAREQDRGATAAPRFMFASAKGADLRLAQADSSGSAGDGYTEQKSQQKIEPPPGYVGHKTVDRQTRTGNTPATAGNHSESQLTAGGFVRTCPDAAGKVPGDFEIAVAIDRTVFDNGAATTQPFAKRFVARLEGQTTDEGDIDYVDLEGTLSSVIPGGVSVSGATVKARFKPDAALGGMPTSFQNLDADQVLAEADLNFVLGAILFSGPNYLAAQYRWMTPNTCVEVEFSPATRKLSFAPSKSFEVAAAVKTKGETRTAVPAKVSNVEELQRTGNGTASPREARIEPGATQNFTYATAARHSRNSGFVLGKVLSRAGAAAGEWLLSDDEYKVALDLTLTQNGDGIGTNIHVVLPETKLEVPPGGTDYAATGSAAVTGGFTAETCTAPANFSAPLKVQGSVDPATPTVFHLEFTAVQPTYTTTMRCTDPVISLPVTYPVEYWFRGPSMTPATVDAMTPFKAELVLQTFRATISGTIKLSKTQQSD